MSEVKIGLRRLSSSGGHLGPRPGSKRRPSGIVRRPTKGPAIAIQVFLRPGQRVATVSKDRITGPCGPVQSGNSGDASERLSATGRSGQGRREVSDMNRPIPWRWMVLSIGLAAVAIGEESSMKRFDFEADKPGDAPQGFSFGRTGQGPAGKWVVQAVGDAPSGRNVLAQTDTD